MKSFIKKIFNLKFIIKLRNRIKFRPIDIILPNTNESLYVSDTFIWRTDNNYKTVFRFSDILYLFEFIKESEIEIHFFDKKNNFIKKKNINNIKISNQITIDKEFIGTQDYGTFYIHQFAKEKIKQNIIFSNRCYIGYIKNNAIPSFLHGNILSKYNLINKKNFNNCKNIVQTINNNKYVYSIQNSYLFNDKLELIFANPTNQKITFEVDNKYFQLNCRECIIVEVLNKYKITIKTNCLFLRPTVFSYKNQFIDVHHS